MMTGMDWWDRVGEALGPSQTGAVIVRLMIPALVAGDEHALAIYHLALDAVRGDTSDDAIRAFEVCQRDPRWAACERDVRQAVIQ